MDKKAKHGDGSCCTLISHPHGKQDRLYGGNNAGVADANHSSDKVVFYSPESTAKNSFTASIKGSN